VGGKLHLMLRMNSRPIAHKYHEGKMKRTLERELKVTELAGREADGSSEAEHSNHTLLLARLANASGTVLLKVLSVVLLALLVKLQLPVRSGIAICIPLSGKG
jgi:hypothetical protein